MYPHSYVSASSRTLSIETEVHVCEPTSDGLNTSLDVTDDARLAELGYKSEFRREFSVSDLASLVGSALMLHFEGH